MASHEAAEGEVAADRKRVGEGASRAVREERRAGRDRERTGTERALGDDRGRAGAGVADHQRTGCEVDALGEGAFRAGQRERARAGLDDRASHADIVGDES